MSLAYRTGTIAVPNAGTTVTGTLTAWINQVKQGDLILLPDGILYEVAANPTVNTTLTIVEPYAGTTVASGGSYAIYRFSDGWRPTAEVNIRLGTLLDRFDATTGFILNGTGVPSDALGEDGDLYIRTDVPSLYSKESGTWSFAASLGGDTGPAGPSYAATSTTSRTLGTGSMTVTTQTGLAYVAGTRVRLSSAASPTTHYMEGVVTAYNSGTGSLTFTSDLFAGSGSRADWNITLAGDRGSQGATGAGYAATSTTSLLIGTGTKAFTTQTGLGYTVGQRARASSAANTANWMEGRVASYSGGTLTLSVDAIGGSGTLADWNINVAGSQGIQGVQGADGNTGLTGANGASYAATSTTSLAIGTGSKVFASQAGLAYVAGSRVRAASAANTSNYMEGICTAYNSGTGSLTIDVAITGGSGTYADWNFSLAGNKGDTGTGFVPRGAYSGATAYVVNDLVQDQSSTWRCILASTGNAPPTLPTTTNAYWEAWAIKGVNGTGAVDSVNGQAGTVVLEADDIEVTGFTPAGYTPTGNNIAQHFAGVSAALLSAGTNRNLLINPDGAINQRAASSAADDTYHVDRWYALTQTAAIGISTLSDVADGVPHMIRLTQSNASAQRIGSAQIIEAKRSKALRGSKATLSAKVRMSAAATLRYAVLAWTGTADAVTSDVVLSWASATYTAGNFFLASSIAVVAEGNVALGANALTDVVLTGDVPSGCNNLIVFFWSSATMAQTATLDYRAKLEKSATATAWVFPDADEENARASYFYQTLGNGLPSYAGSATSIRCGSSFPYKMRTTPTITISTTTPAFIIGAAATTGSGSTLSTSTADATGVRALINGFTGLTTSTPGHCQNPGLIICDAEL